MTLQDTIHDALKNWHKTTSTAGLLVELRLFSQYYPARTRCQRTATNEILQAGLGALELENKPAADLLRKRFLDEQKLSTLSNRAVVSEKTLHRYQASAIARLTQIIASEDAKLSQREHERLLVRIPVTNSEMVGLDATLGQVKKILAANHAPWVVGLEGLGGLGKTTLAAAIARQTIAEGVFDELVWLTLSPQLAEQPTGLLDRLWRQVEPEQPGPDSDAVLLAAVQSRLANRSSIIVLDNLETVQDVEAVLPLIRDLANPAKILITSRTSLTDIASVYIVPLQELTSTEALLLLRSVAQLRNIDLTAMSDAAFERVYAVTGGNPLALKLILNQLRLHGLNGALQNLADIRGSGAAELYDHIYRRAWNSLNDTGRSVLLALAAAADGVNLALLAVLTQLAENDIIDALELLARFSLIEITGGLHERYYRLHPLTRAFVRQKVVKCDQ